MSDTVSFAELDGQHVELLPARTVLSMFSAQGGGPTPGGGPIPGGGLVPSSSLGSFLTQAAGLPGMNSGADGSNTDGAAGANKS